MSDMTIVAQDGPTRFLLSTGVKRSGVPIGQIADTLERVIYPSATIPSLMARGNWRDPKPGISIEDILAVVDQI